ncbi:MAG: YihY/virulence factor BrkB family protein [Chloroflexi bacterium]|nr:YihY/virulence factor BrkB family protein [Chloroflexota bacterium]
MRFDRADRRGRALVHGGGRRLRAYRAGRLALDLVPSIGRDDLAGGAAEMAFRFAFAIPPFLLLVLALASAAQQFTNRDLAAQLVSVLGHVMPPQVVEPVQAITAQVLAADPLGIGIVGLVGALWGGSGAARTLMKCLNRAYRVDGRVFWRQYLVAFGATLLLPVLAIGGIAVYLVTGDFVGPIGDLFGASAATVALWHALRWPLVLMSVTGTLWLVYRFLPHVRQGWLSALPGALVATLGWLALARGFEFYLQNVARIPAAVGSLGLAMVTLVWLYSIGLIVLLGAELNAAIRRTARLDDPMPPAVIALHDDVAEGPDSRGEGGS